MDIFSVFTMLGGLAMFLYGMSIMGDGLEKSAGNRLKGILETASKTPIRGLILGAVVTAVIQSSSATTVMVVGFVNSGLMRLSQAIGIIMGANIGTTATSWILSLTGLQGDTFFIKMLKPSSFSPILAAVGIIMYMFIKNGKKKDLGTIFLGFAILMFGMETMSDAVAPLKDIPEFQQLFTKFENPILGVLVGALVTAIIQSSSASVGILQALSATGAISLGSAIPIILGQNIGTCATAMISSLGTNKNARRTALVHLYFNVIGTLAFLILYYGLNMIFRFSFVEGAANAFNIAIVHTVFNVVATGLMLPFNKVLEKLAYMTIPEDEEKEVFSRLDERLFEAPSIAIGRCHDIAAEMANLASASMLRAMSLLDKFDPEIAAQVVADEDAVDKYEDELGSYLVKLSNRNLSHQDSLEITELLHNIGDSERISDHAMNIMETAQEMYEKNATFSEEAWVEINKMKNALQTIMEMAITAFEKNDLEMALKVEPLEDVVDDLKSILRGRHIERLKANKCTIELGFMFSDLLTNYERVSDHCSNIAVSLLTSAQDNMDVHAFLNESRKLEKEYQDLYKEYQAQFGV
ncbi:MAG: Na/Pi cotransporter family protein [Firmicutes bacterium]|nr:Na/Pi cotransporter family protein [Bacillota bacterium]